MFSSCLLAPVDLFRKPKMKMWRLTFAGEICFCANLSHSTHPRWCRHAAGVTNTCRRCTVECKGTTSYMHITICATPCYCQRMVSCPELVWRTNMIVKHSIWDACTLSTVLGMNKLHHIQHCRKYIQHILIYLHSCLHLHIGSVRSVLQKLSRAQRLNILPTLYCWCIQLRRRLETEAFHWLYFASLKWDGNDENNGSGDSMQRIVLHNILLQIVVLRKIWCDIRILSLWTLKLMEVQWCFDTFRKLVSSCANLQCCRLTALISKVTRENPG